MNTLNGNPRETNFLAQFGKLLSVSSDAKTKKGEKLGILTGVMYLAPAAQAGMGINTCPFATVGCESACLFTAGRASFDPKIPKARIARTRAFTFNRDAFMAQLIKEIKALIRKAKRDGLRPVIRLNGTSDIRWEKISVTYNGETYKNVMDLFPEITFYDYTKNPNRKNLPANYSLTFSLADGNDTEALQALENGLNVAAVFRVARSKDLPSRYMGREVVDGDLSDARFLDPRNVIVGLRAKGEAKKDTSGFVKDV